MNWDKLTMMMQRMLLENCRMRLLGMRGYRRMIWGGCWGSRRGWRSWISIIKRMRMRKVRKRIIGKIKIIKCNKNKRLLANKIKPHRITHKEQPNKKISHKLATRTFNKTCKNSPSLNTKKNTQMTWLTNTTIINPSNNNNNNNTNNNNNRWTSNNNK